MDAASLKRYFPEPRAGRGVNALMADAQSSVMEAPETQGFTLVVEFGGLCAFLPAQNGRAMYAFLPKALQSGPGVLRHQSVLQFMTSDLAGTALGPSGASGLLKLHERDLRITFSEMSETPNLVIDGFDYGPNNLAVPPLGRLPELSSHFGWVSSVEDACVKRGAPGAGVMDRRFLDASLSDEYADLLDARVALTTGTVGSFGFLGKEDSVVIFRYRPFDEEENNPRDHRQFAASKVRLEVEVPSDFVRIESRDLRDPDDLEVLELRPSPDPDRSITARREVRIVILNEEAEAILGLESPPNFKIGAPRTQDRIFETYAQLCPGARELEEKQQLPIPVAAAFRRIENCKSKGPLHSTAPCSPLRVG